MNDSASIELKRRHAITGSLRDTLRMLNQTNRMDMVLNYLADQARSLMDAHAAAIYRYMPHEQVWLLEASSDLPRDFAVLKVMPFQGTLLWSVIFDRKPYAITDIQAQMPALAADSHTCPVLDHWLNLNHIHYGAFMGVPLIVGGAVYGMIGLHYNVLHTFSSEDVQAALMLADQDALVIENALLRQEAEQAAVTAERNRLARDLHDSVTQTLFSASLIADVMPNLWERDQIVARDQLRVLRHLTRGAMAEMRTLLLELRPETLFKSPLEETLRHLVDATTGRAGIPVALSLDADLALPSDVRVALYRIAQEALNNVAKHADARSAHLRVYQQGLTRIMSIEDDGLGFDLAAVSPSSLGLNIMRERSESIQARLLIQSQPNQGTRVTVYWQKDGTT